MYFSVHGEDARLRYAVPTHGQPAAAVTAAAAARLCRLALSQGLRPSLRLHPPPPTQLNQHTVHLPTLIQLQQEPQKGIPVLERTSNTSTEMGLFIPPKVEFKL
jgi:hypothetical protein